MNNDLISRSALLADYCGGCDLIETCWCDGDRCATGQMIMDVPAVDAVEVCRCEDCKYCEKMLGDAEDGFWGCLYHREAVEPNDFCSYGERECDE